MNFQSPNWAAHLEKKCVYVAEVIDPEGAHLFFVGKLGVIHSQFRFC